MRLVRPCYRAREEANPTKTFGRSPARETALWVRETKHPDSSGTFSLEPQHGLASAAGVVAELVDALGRRGPKRPRKEPSMSVQRKPVDGPARQSGTRFQSLVALTGHSSSGQRC